jgi:hypothetical protein
MLVRFPLPEGGSLVTLFSARQVGLEQKTRDIAEADNEIYSKA